MLAVTKDGHKSEANERAERDSAEGIRAILRSHQISNMGVKPLHGYVRVWEQREVFYVADKGRQSQSRMKHYGENWLIKCFGHPNFLWDPGG